MENDLFQKIIDEHKELSSLPQTLAEVLRVSRDGESSARDFANVIMHDPGLAAKVLRMANSPYFGAGRAVSSMTQAVMTLGMRAVTALVLSASVYDLTGQWQSSVDRVRFWRHSLCVAIAAQELAKAMRYECPEEAFVAGLLHDLGLLVIEKSFPEKFERLWRQAESGEEITDLEETAWGTNHARVGQFLLEQWHLPEAICQAVGRHHFEFPADTTDPEYRLPQIVALANMVSHFSITRTRPRYRAGMDHKETICANLRFDPAKLLDIRDELLQKTLEESRFLEMDIGSIEDLLTEANRMLYDQYVTLEKVLRENRAMQRDIARAQLEKSALETLKTITATFNHYINNAVGTILGRAQLVQLDIQKGRLADSTGNAVQSMEVIVNGVKTIRNVMDELTNLSAFKTTIYYDDTYIIDIEKKIKDKIENIENITAIPG